MSTRCQVQVIGADKDMVTLYHHCDGYPTNMLPLMQKAFELSGQGWEAARGRKCASFLCAADPGQFEPEAGHALHGDIEWYYQLHCEGEMHTGCHAEWFVTVYEMTGWGENQTKVTRRAHIPLSSAIEQAETIENEGREE